MGERSSVPRQSGGIFCHASLRGPFSGPDSISLSGPVSHASPMGSGRFIFSGYIGASEREPQMRGMNLGAIRVGAGRMDAGGTFLRGGFRATEETAKAAQAFVDALDGGGVGEAEVAGSSESFSGYDCDLHFV